MEKPQELQDLLRLLEERPEWRERLLLHLLPYDPRDLPRHLGEAVRHLEEMAEAQKETVEALRSLTYHLRDLAEGLDLLLEPLLVRRVEPLLCALLAPDLEEARPLDPGDLARRVEEAVRAGRLEEREGWTLLEGGLVLRGRRRDTGREAFAAVVPAWKAGGSHAHRAGWKARLLARALEAPVLPVVVGLWEDLTDWDWTGRADVRRVVLHPWGPRVEDPGEWREG